MNFLRRYLMVIFVCISLLFGIQVPNFLDQYAKRVDAHLREVAINLQSYQKIADKYHNSDLQTLIAEYKANSKPTYQEAGLAVETMYLRKIMFEKDEAAISSGILLNLFHMVTEGNPELLKETLEKYSYAVPLNQDALVAGGIIALVTIFLVEMLFAVLGSLMRVMRTKGLRKTQKKQSLALSVRG